MNINEVAEEIKAILIEAEFTARWGLIEATHEVGKLILGLEGERTQLLQAIAVRVGRSERSLWYAVKFAEKYKNVNDLPEGKNISMNQVIKKYLTDSSKPEEVCQHVPIIICAKCREVLDTHPQIKI